jgi:asparagine synthase (glutamine-hydrolysing)
VFHARQIGGTCQAYILKGSAGVILGKLFEGDLDTGHGPSELMFDDKESHLVLESQGRCLIHRYWGHYVAFLRDFSGKRRFILRDPTGGLPCYLTETAGIDVILSDIDDCVVLRVRPLSVDWEHIAAFFVHSRLVTRSTGHKEVKQLHAGECAAIHDDGVSTRSFYWNPVDIYEAKAIEQPAEARARLGRVIRHCVNAWASCYDSIVHELSGGLDSSIVAACLAKGGGSTEVLCFNFFTQMSEGDERLYARAAAQSTGYALVETEACVSERTLESLFNPSRIATPARLGFLPASELLKQRLVIERRAGAIFTGQGGDHLFQQAGNKHIAAEYTHRHGLKAQLFGVVADVSRLTNQSIWSVFSAAITHGLLRRSFDPYTIFEAPSILSYEARASLSPHAYKHPWVENASSLPASKIKQVFDIVDCQPFYLRPCANAEQVHPLISQPIIEHCLQIPTYVLAHGGRDRGLVREAFAADVPTKIINRRSKGGTSSYFNRVRVENAQFLRESLLDGILVRNGVLERRELEKQLSERELILGKGLTPILNAARAEKWLSTWADARGTAA